MEGRAHKVTANKSTSLQDMEEMGAAIWRYGDGGSRETEGLHSNVTYIRCAALGWLQSEAKFGDETGP